MASHIVLQVLGSAVSAGGKLTFSCKSDSLRIEYASPGDNGWPSRSDVPDTQLCNALFDTYLGDPPCVSP